MMRWPFMTKAEHERQVAELRSAYQGFVDREYTRATRDGNTRVHAFMVDANAAVFAHPRPDVAVRAVFQQAEREFRPEPLTLAERLHGPADLQEAISSAQ